VAIAEASIEGIKLINNDDDDDDDDTQHTIVNRYQFHDLSRPKTALQIICQ
jgi:hypothetical protein